MNQNNNQIDNITELSDEECARLGVSKRVFQAIRVYRQLGRPARIMKKYLTLEEARAFTRKYKTTDQSMVCYDWMQGLNPKYYTSGECGPYRRED